MKQKAKGDGSEIFEEFLKNSNWNSDQRCRWQNYYRMFIVGPRTSAVDNFWWLMNIEYVPDIFGALLTIGNKGQLLGQSP